MRVEDNSPKVFRELENKINKALYFSGIEMQKDIINYMWNDKVYDTGRLMASISFITPVERGIGKAVGASQPGDQLHGKAPERTVVIGSNTPYAAIVNQGYGQRPREFMQHGINQTIPKLRTVIKKTLEGGK